MIEGKIISANLGNVLPTKSKYTFSLANSDLVEKIAKKIRKQAPDILLLQEVWDFTRKLVGENYEFLGLNDSIAIKKDFAQIILDSFKSHSTKFKKKLDSPIYPDVGNEQELKDHKKRLDTNPYIGNPDSPYGIPADFDLTSLIIKTRDTSKKLMVANAHLYSGPWNADKRVYQINNWILGDVLPRAKKDCDERLIIAGDFNHDEDRQKGKCSQLMQELETKHELKEAADENKEVTTNYPFFVKNYRYDHIFGTANFSNYQVTQSLLKEDFQKLKRKKPLYWWMYLDHKMISCKFKFNEI